MSEPRGNERLNLLNLLIRFTLERKLVVFLLAAVAVGWGLHNAPFAWDLGGLPRDPVPVDAIPDIGENQQIVFTDWPGRSPQDVEDQVTYPLTVSLLGMPGVKTVRSFSMFGFSTIYVIFEEGIEFYWSRSRVLEKLASLPEGILPPDVRPALGPDATALGQVFWYTLEGRDQQGHPAPGWDLQELRSIQDWQVRYALQAAHGVSEVASIGGFVQEYQVDLDPDAMQSFGVTIEEVVNAVRGSNLDVGARTIEINRVEYVIRGVGFIKSLEDLNLAVVRQRENLPVYLRDVARVSLGPALRRGVLDKGGAEVVGGVVVVRYGDNPMAAIENVRRKIAEIAPGLPSRTLEDGRVSKVTVVPFYDRTGLIQETLGTLNDALYEEILIAAIVILVTIMHLGSSLVISALLPLAVLIVFIAMRAFGIDANIVALSGIAIAIGTMVDVGVIMMENTLRHLELADPAESRLEVVYRATCEVGSAVLTGVATTVVSFLPVFAMTGPEGKLFRPLAFTKTFALTASIMVGLMLIPPVAHLMFRRHGRPRVTRRSLGWVLVALGAVLLATVAWWAGLLVLALGLYRLFGERLPERWRGRAPLAVNSLAVLAVLLVLARHWLPLGPEQGFTRNALFVVLMLGGLMAAFLAFLHYYRPVLGWCLEHKLLFLSLPMVFVLLGGFIWLGFDRFFGWWPARWQDNQPYTTLVHAFPGLGKEFMPPLDEGSFLYMPTTMPHASIAEAGDVVRLQDMRISAIPEVESAVGKIGRVESALDPAPISMTETVIGYYPEFLLDGDGHRRLFRFDPDSVDYFRNAAGETVPALDGQPYLVRGAYPRDEAGRLIPDGGGMPLRLWRPALDPELNDHRAAWGGIQSPGDIWDQIQLAGKLPGSTGAPRLQPIAARLVMLQSGMRAPMGVKVQGPSLEAIDGLSLAIERLLQEVPRIDPATVVADRVIGKPYLELHVDRRAAARHGLSVAAVQEVIETAVGGRAVTTTVEGRERYAVRVRYLRERRDDLESLERILVPTPAGAQVPLGQLARLEYQRGPQMIRSEDTFLTAYVVFDKRPGWAEVEVVEQAREYLERAVAEGRLELPTGTSYRFAGSYENQVHSEKTLMVILPLALAVIFLILYLQFSSVLTTTMVFSGIAVAWAGGFILIWLYAQPWFMDLEVFGANLRGLFQVGPVHLSVAVWVGFLALFGIASDDGVVMATYLDQVFDERRPATIAEVRAATLEAGSRRVRPALMTTAITILALLPVLTSTGRGSDIMVPMAIPSVGGMTLQIITMLIVPVLYSAVRERRARRGV